MRKYVLWALALLGLPAVATERKFDFSDVRENQAPPGFRSVVTGQGKPGDWRVIMDEVPPLLQPITPGSAGRSPRRPCSPNWPRTPRMSISRC